MNPRKLSVLSIQNIRKSLERKIDDKRVKDKEFISYMKYLLMCEGNEEIQTEAAWIFTNIAAGSAEQTTVVVKAGIVPLLIKILSSPNRELVEQAIWALGNIVGDSVENRNIVLEHGLLEPLLSYITGQMTTSFQRTIVWVLVNIVRCREYPLSIQMAAMIVPKLCFLAKRRDVPTKIDAFWALTFIADGADNYIQLIVDSDIISTAMPMLTNQNQKLQVTTMRFLGNIATGTDDQTQVLLDHGILNNMRFALIHHNRNLRRVSLWCLSNISIGTQSQAQEIFHSGLLPVITDNLNHVDTKIVKEAVLTVRNLINAGSIEQMLEIIECRCINPMFSLILNDDIEISDAARQSLNVIFTKGRQLVEKYTQMQVQMINDTSSF